MKIKTLCLLFPLFILISSRLMGQNSYVLDSQLKVDCINCQNPNNPPIFKIFLLNRYSDHSDKPEFGMVSYGDTIIDPIHLYLSDTVEVNCVKYYTYGPLYYTCESFGESYPLKVSFKEGCKFFTDSSNFKLKFEIFVPRITLFNSSNIQILNPAPLISKNSDQVNLSIIQNNNSSFYSEFELIKTIEDSTGIILNNKLTPTLSIHPKLLSPNYHSFKIRAYGQLEESGGNIHMSESFHTFYLDTLIKPINWFDFTHHKSIDKINKLISQSKLKDSLIIQFKVKLNGYNMNQLDFNFNVHNRILNPIHFEMQSINDDTLIGSLILPYFNYPKKQYVSLTISEKERCGLLFADNWELVSDSMINNNVEKIESIPEYKVFPNPLNNTLNISSFQPAEFELINSLGISVLKDRIVSGNNQYEIPNLAVGIYTMKISSNNSVRFYKILKINP